MPHGYMQMRDADERPFLHAIGVCVHRQATAFDPTACGCSRCLLTRLPLFCSDTQTAFQSSSMGAAMKLGGTRTSRAMWRTWPSASTPDADMTCDDTRPSLMFTFACREKGKW